MDKIEKLYQLYLKEGMITEAISLERFRNITPDQQASILEVSRKRKLISPETSLESFQSIWGNTMPQEQQAPEVVENNSFSNEYARVPQIPAVVDEEAMNSDLKVRPGNTVVEVAKYDEREGNTYKSSTNPSIRKSGPFEEKVIYDKNATPLDRSLAFVNEDMFRRDEEPVVELLNYHFPYEEYGFKFEESGILDNVTVTAPDGTKESFGIDSNFGFQNNAEESRKIRDFIRKNADQKKENEDITKKYFSKEAVDLDIAIFTEENKKLTKSAEDYFKRKEINEAELKRMRNSPGTFTQQEYDLQMMEKNYLRNQENVLKGKYEQFQQSASQLDLTTGNYVLMKEGQGNTVTTAIGGAYNKFLEGTSSVISTVGGTGLDIYYEAAQAAYGNDVGYTDKEYRDEFIRVYEGYKGLEVPEYAIDNKEGFEKWVATLKESDVDSVKDSATTASKRDGVRLNYDAEGQVIGESTHKMRAETDGNGNWFAFPTLFQNEDGSWNDTYEKQIKKSERDWKGAYEEAKKRGELVVFGSDKEAAFAYADGSWKPNYDAEQTATLESARPTGDLEGNMFTGKYKVVKNDPRLQNLNFDQYDIEKGVKIPFESSSMIGQPLLQWNSPEVWSKEEDDWVQAPGSFGQSNVFDQVDALVGDQKIKGRKNAVKDVTRNILVETFGVDNVSDQRIEAQMNQGGAAGIIATGFYGAFESVPALAPMIIGAVKNKKLVKPTGPSGKSLKAIKGRLIQSLKNYATDGYRQTSLLAMAALHSDKLNEQMENNPEFEWVTENEKKALILPLATTSAILETLGFRMLLKGTSGTKILTGITSAALRQLPKGATPAMFRRAVINIMDNQFTRRVGKTGVAKFINRATPGVLAEAETGFFQEYTDIEGKNIYNAFKGKELFKNPERWSEEYWTQIGKAAGAEAVGGFVLGAPSSITAAFTSKEKITEVNEEMVALFDKIFVNKNNSQDDSATAIKAYEASVQQKMDEGLISRSQGTDMLNDFRTLQAAATDANIATDLNKKQKAKAIELFFKKRQLEVKMSQTNKNLPEYQEQQEVLEQIEYSISLLGKNQADLQSQRELEEQGIETYVEVTEEEVMEALKQDGIEAPTEQQKIDKSDELIKTKQNALQEQSTEGVVQEESAEGSGEVGQTVPSNEQSTNESTEETETNIEETTEEEVVELKKEESRLKKLYKKALKEKLDADKEVDAALDQQRIGATTPAIQKRIDEANKGYDKAYDNLQELQKQVNKNKIALNKPRKRTRKSKRAEFLENAAQILRKKYGKLSAKVENSKAETKKIIDKLTSSINELEREIRKIKNSGGSSLSKKPLSKTAEKKIITLEKKRDKLWNKRANLITDGVFSTDLEIEKQDLYTKITALELQRDQNESGELDEASQKKIDEEIESKEKADKVETDKNNVKKKGLDKKGQKRKADEKVVRLKKQRDKLKLLYEQAKNAVKEANEDFQQYKKTKKPIKSIILFGKNKLDEAFKKLNQVDKDLSENDRALKKAIKEQAELKVEPKAKPKAKPKAEEEIDQQTKDDLDEFFEGQSTEQTKSEPSISLNRSKGKLRLSLTDPVKIIRAVKKAAKAMAKTFPSVKFILHDSTELFSKATGKYGSGFFNPTTKTIHINMETASVITVAHEVTHAVANQLISTDAKAEVVFDKVLVSLQKILKDTNPKLLEKVEKFSKRYSDKTQRSEEAVSELMGILAAEWGTLSRPKKNKIIDLLDRFFKKLGIPSPFKNKLSKTDEAVLEFFNTVSKKIREGESIAIEDVSILSELASEEQGESGVSGTINTRQGRESIEAPNPENDPRPWVRKLVTSIKVSSLNGQKFVTNMYDYTTAGITDLGNGYTVDLLGGRNYVPYIMSKLGKKIGDVSNLAAFNTKAQAEGFIRNAIEGAASLFAPHSGTLNNSWQFQQHIFAALTDLVLDNDITTNQQLINSWNEGLIRTPEALKKELAKYKKNLKKFEKSGYYIQDKERVFEAPVKPTRVIEPLKKFIKKYNQEQAKKGSNLPKLENTENLNDFLENPKELVRLLNIENNFSPDLRKRLNQKIAVNKQFKNAIGINNVNEFHQKMMDPLNKGVTGAEIMNFVKFDNTTFEVVQTKETDVDHHPSFGWVVKAKIEGIYQPTRFYKSQNITDQYVKYNKNETVVSKKEDVTEKKFASSNVSSSAGSIPKVAEVNVRKGKEQLSTPKFENSLEQKYGIDLDLFENKGFLELDKIIITENQRNKGIGTKVMNEVIDFANQKGLTIALTPSDSYGATSVGRLKSFYKGLGFVENKGENKDFTTKQSMLKIPSRKGREQLPTLQEVESRITNRERFMRTVNSYGMKKNGYMNIGSDLGPLQRAVREYGFRIETRYITEGRRRGTPTGYFLTTGRNAEGFPIMYNPKLRELKALEDQRPKRKGREQALDKESEAIKIAMLGREEGGFTESEIKYYLKKRGFPASDIKIALAIDPELFPSFPKSFGNIIGGFKNGVKLLAKINKFHKKVIEDNNNKKKYKQESLSKLVNKTIEYLYTTPEYQALGVKGGRMTSKQQALEVDLLNYLSPGIKSFNGARVRALNKQIKNTKFSEKNVKRIQRALRLYIRTVMPRNLLGKAAYVKLIDKINAVDETNYNAIVAEVTDIATELSNKNLNKSILDILNEAFTQIQSGRSKGVKVTQEVKDRIYKIAQNTIGYVPGKKGSQGKVPSKVEDITNDEMIQHSEMLRQKIRSLETETVLINGEKVTVNRTLTPEEAQEIGDLAVALQYSEAIRLFANNDPLKTNALEQVLFNLSQMQEFGVSGLQLQLLKNASAYMNNALSLLRDMGVSIDPLKELEAEGKENITQNDVLKKFRELKQKIQIDAQRGKITKVGVRKRLSLQVSQIAKYVNAKLGTAEDLTGLMDRISLSTGDLFGGVAQEIVTKEVRGASRVFKGRMLKHELELAIKMTELFGNKWLKKNRQNNSQTDEIIVSESKQNVLIDERNRILKDKKMSSGEQQVLIQAIDKEINSNTKMISQNELLYYRNQGLDLSLTASFETTFQPTPLTGELAYLNKEFDNKSEYTSRIQEEITKKLDPKLIELGDWMVKDFYPKQYDHYNNTYKAIYRTDMPWNQNYAGRLYRESEKNNIVGLDLMDTQGNQTWISNASANSTKFRQESSSAIMQTNAVDALLNYTRDMEYFAAYAVPIRNINRMFSDEAVKATISEKFGKDINRYINDQITKIANKGAKHQKSAGLINFFNNTFLLSRLGLNPTLVLKQMTSFVTYGNDIGYNNWLLQAGKTGWSGISSDMREIMDNSVVLQDRYGAPITRVLETYQDEGFKKLDGQNDAINKYFNKENQNTLVKALMAFTMAGDKGAIMLGGLPNYRYYKEQFKKQNPNATEQEAIDHAIVKFEADTLRTQQSYDLQDKDYWQTSNAFARAFNMFLTTPKQYLRREIIAARNFSRLVRSGGKQGKGTVWQNARTLFVYHSVMPMFFQYVSMGLPGLFRDRRDEDLQELGIAALMGNINALFIIGDLVEMSVDQATGKPWGSQAPSIPIFEQAARLNVLKDRADKTKNPIKKAEYEMKYYLELSTLVGIPAPQLMRMGKNFSELATGDVDGFGDALMKAFNFSEFAQEGRKVREATPKPATMTMAEMKKYLPEEYAEIMREQEEYEYENADEIEELELEKDEARREYEEAMREMYLDN